MHNAGNFKSFARSAIHVGKAFTDHPRSYTLGTTICNFIQGLFREKVQLSIYKTDVTTRTKQVYSSQSKNLS